jgi:hypothetical protein
LKNKISSKIFYLAEGITIYALMTFLYKETAVLNTLIFPKVDGFLSHLDQKIFGFQPSLRFSETFDSWYFSELFYFGYFCYYLLPLVVLGILYKFLPQKIEEFGFILISSFLLYYFIFIIIPAEGPHVIWDVKLTRVCSVILGLYNIILAICFEKDLSIFLFIVDLILYMLLDIGFLMVKLKKDKKGKVKNFQLGICSIFVILAMIMACFNLNEIYSSIMILSGMMMVISTPFQKMKSLRENSNNR